ncbi:uncharacterized protein LOC119724741 [Patiria miniata]|uniref:Uncharacterized protein n=1 Tax=Patiria miniata TaxID=46514 RepID=A0A913ZLD7_PATMI|nr:uncharacterized protein LOC119724741 [Patiria miniata]
MSVLDATPGTTPTGRESRPTGKMARQSGTLLASARRSGLLPTFCRRQKYVILIACVSVFGCVHLLTGSVGLFSAGLERQETAAGQGMSAGSGDIRRMNELGGAALWPPPPSSHRDPVIHTGEFPFNPVRPLYRAARVNGNIHSLSRGRERLDKRHVVPFPWPERQKFIPNYFLNYDNLSRSSSDEDKVAKFDSSSVLVYLHHNKAAGTTTKRCLATIAGADLGRTTGPVLSSEGRLAVEARFIRSRRFMMRSSPNTYFGGYAFGICDRYRKPCAYFTVLRDPYERTLSSHSYCKHARQDQLCSAQVANKVSLREWALHQGSFFFRQLLFQPEFCSDKTRWMRNVDVEGVPHDFLNKRDSLRSAPCWFREKLIMELTLNHTQHEALLKYCLKNLERWFTVIMLVDHYDESLQMAQEALKLPVHDLCAGRHDNTGSYNKTANPVTASKLPDQNRTSPTSPATSDPSVEEQLLELRQDPEVRSVLRADELLYQRGVEIFNKQRAVFSKIRSILT